MWQKRHRLRLLFNKLSCSRSKPINMIRSSLVNTTQGNTVHGTAKTGFVDGKSYDKNRPTYTDEAVTFISSFINEKSPYDASVKYDCVELGAGTGKLTQKLIKNLPSTARYLGTEPIESFAQTLRKNCPEVSVQICSADNIPAESNTVKCVVAAQCFHWFANVKSLTEIHRVLIPKGKFVMVWNNKNWKVPWVHEVEDILTRYYGNTPRAVKYEWKTVVEQFAPFRCVHHTFLEGTAFEGNKKDVVNHFCSVSVIASLEDKERQKVRDQMHLVLEKHEETRHRQEIHIPFQTEIYICEKTD